MNDAKHLVNYVYYIVVTIQLFIGHIFNFLNKKRLLSFRYWYMWNMWNGKMIFILNSTQQLKDC